MTGRRWHVRETILIVVTLAAAVLVCGAVVVAWVTR